MSNKVQQEHSVNKTFWLVLWLIVVVLVYHFPEKMINPYLNTHTTCWIFYLKQCCRLVVKLLFHCGLFWSTMYKFLHFWGCTNKNQKLEFTLRVGRQGVVKRLPVLEERLAVTNGWASIWVLAHQWVEVDTKCGHHHHAVCWVRFVVFPLKSMVCWAFSVADTNLLSAIRQIGLGPPARLPSMLLYTVNC